MACKFQRRHSHLGLKGCTPIPIGKRSLAYHAIRPVLHDELIPLIITAMILLQIIVQTILEWARAMLVDILGRRLEEMVSRFIKRRRDKKLENTASTDVPESK